jgi:hypothetical protein
MSLASHLARHRLPTRWRRSGAPGHLHERADEGERTRSGRTALIASFAAGLVTLVLGYPAYLGLSRVPRLARELAAVRAEMDRPGPKTKVDVGRPPRAAAPAAVLPSVPFEWRGPAAVHYLRPAHRGAGGRGAGDDDGAVEVAIAPDEPFVLLALGEELLSDHIRPGREYTFEIAERRVTLGARRILAELSSPASAVILPVPAEVLTEGSHDVTVREQGAHGRPILVVPFRVRRHLQSPAATNAPQ